MLGVLARTGGEGGTLEADTAAHLAEQYTCRFVIRVLRYKFAQFRPW